MKQENSENGIDEICSFVAVHLTQSQVDKVVVVSLCYAIVC